MRLDETVINRGILLGASIVLHGYYGLIQGYYEVSSYVTGVWGIVNLVLLYTLIKKINECKNSNGQNIMDNK